MIGIGSALDIEIWQYARDNDYMIVTKDADFSELGGIKGFPPKVIWIRRGNCSTRDIKPILRENYTAISALSYEQFGFRDVKLSELPPDFYREYLIGKIITTLISIFNFRNLNIMSMKSEG